MNVFASPEAQVVFTALVVTFLVVFIRALPWPEVWRKHKPLRCDACMVGWLLLALALGFGRGLTLAEGLRLTAAGGLALLAIALQAKWRGEADQAAGWNGSPPAS